MSVLQTDIAIIGTGIVGIATAYYLAKNHGKTNLLLIDRGQPMAFTSAQSGENYRNWWPHPHMMAFTDRSIGLLENFARESDNRINMTRRGYCLATREKHIDALVAQLHQGADERAAPTVRYHTDADAPAYRRSIGRHWECAPDGVDILLDQRLIRKAFPSYSSDVQAVVHIRRAGDFSGQQLGMMMLEYLKAQGVKRTVGTVECITQGEGFTIELQAAEGACRLHARTLVNAAGPFANDIARMIDVDLPLSNTFQQKIAFDDREGAIPRDLPFSVDLDPQHIDWDDEERALLAIDEEYRGLIGTMPGAVHCRPDGGDRGTWLKLGWAFNAIPVEADWAPPLQDYFPEIVLRGAARLNPSLRCYYGRLPRSLHHYGGWYTMTDENWPLIGPMGPDGAFMNCAYSGFGTMAACAGGELCAAWIAGVDLPFYASGFSLDRYQDTALIQLLRDGNRGIL